MTLSHFLIFLDISVPVHRSQRVNDWIYHTWENICRCGNTTKHFRTWTLFIEGPLYVCGGLDLPCELAFGEGAHGEKLCRTTVSAGSPCNSSQCFLLWVLWPSKLQILLSHLGVTCLPRRCQRSVTCYTALVSVNYTSQVRWGWQDYYNIWCDVAFCYHHLTLSSFPKLWEWKRCYVVHMTGLYLRVWRKDTYMLCALVNCSSWC